MTRRTFLLFFVSLIAFLIITLIRLFYVQIIKGKEYKELSKRNHTRTRILYPPRGDIYDRNGKLLAYDEPVYVLMIDYHRLSKKELEKVERELKKLFNVDLKKVLEKKMNGIEPVKLKENLTREELETFYANDYKLPGVFVETFPKRVYPYGKRLCHVLGYVGYPSERDFKSIKKRIAPQSLVGKMGIERSMNDILLGELGEEKVMVNALGKVIKTLSRKEPKKGNSIVLTIDIRMQKIVEDVFEESGQIAGAVILMNAKTGEILALASFPGFDPNRVYEDWRNLRKNPLKPLFNRALMGRYPPASVLKVPISYALLELQMTTPWNKVLCTGRFYLGGREFLCWFREGHGEVNMIKALYDSCDVYYYHHGYELGPSTIVRYARKFGYGERIPLEIPVKRGFLPTPEWKRRRFKEPWYDGDTLNLSIGQGFMLSTLMEQSLMMMGIVNNGVIYRPTLLREIRDSSGNVIWRNRKKVWKVVRGNQEYFAIIRRALREVVRKGTGRSAFSRIVDIAGKTGTAQVTHIRDRKKKRKLPWRLRDHAWFIGFAPYRDPAFIIGVLVEHGESGGRVAAPIARKILERIYIEKLNREI